MELIDLSMPITDTPDGTPEILATTVERSGHAEGAAIIEQMFGVPPRLLRDGEGWANDRLILGTHNSTHVDAPWHYNSTIAGRPAATIDELPLERFYGPGVVVDATGREDGDALTAVDMKDGIARAGHELKPGDIVLVHSGCDRYLDAPDYMAHGPGVTAEATHWLYERGVRLMGIDAWGWDRPLHLQAAEAIERDAAGVFWEAHQADLDYSQIERLCALDRLPPTGFHVACFPLRIVGASGAPARVVAFV